MLDFPDLPALGEFYADRLWDGAKWADEENHWAAIGYPIGAMLDWTRREVPRYWLACDGRAIERTKFAALFAVLGEDYGPGNGITTFNLPDSRSRAFMGGDAVGTAGGDQRVGAHTHPVTDLGHTHALYDPGHNHVMWQNPHAHGIPDPGHGHGGQQSPHDHGIGDPGHNHAVHDPSHAHGQGHSWGYMQPVHYGNHGVDCSVVIDDWAGWSVNGAYTHVYNDANWTGIGWHGEWAWIACEGAYTGAYMDANNAAIAYNVGGASLTVDIGNANLIVLAGGDGTAANVQPTMVVNKIIYTGVP